MNEYGTALAGSRPVQPAGGGTYRKSSSIEKIVEYRLIADLAAEMYRRGLDMSVLRDDIDCHGRDLLLEACGILRQVQLKAMTAAGKRDSLTINLQLATKPSACIVWFDYDPLTLTPTKYRWFGGVPGERMPSLGSRVARSTTANSLGEKADRTGHRILRRGRLKTIETMAELADHLFGPADGLAAERQRLVDHLISRPIINEAAWIEEARIGCFSSIPARLDAEQAGALAHMVDGFQLLGVDDGGDAAAAASLERSFEQAKRDGRWQGRATELWILLFLEHRRQRFADGFPLPDDRSALVDLLAEQLRAALVELEQA